jgi:delta14-sterol reductase
MSVQNPKTMHYEFFGPVGAAFISTTVPITIYGLYFNCSEASRGCSPSVLSLPVDFVKATSSIDWLRSLFDGKAMIAYFHYRKWRYLT